MFDDDDTTIEAEVLGPLDHLYRAQVDIGMAIDLLQRQRREAGPEALRDEALKRLRAALGDEAARN
jgi:hypothetical protein